MLFTQIGSQRISLTGINISCTVPNGTNKIRIAPESGDLRYTLNGNPASIDTGSCLYGDAISWLNITGNLNIYGSGAIANIVYISGI